MPDKKTDDHIPEFAHLDTVTRRRELAAAGPNPNQKLDALRKSLKMPNLVSVETEVDSLIIDSPPRGCIDRFEVLGLSVGPNQRLQKKIYDQYFDGERCIRTTSTVNFQFMGYGPYTQSFFRNVGNTNPLENFFRDVAVPYGVNLHRTMVFANEVWEGFPRDQVLRVLSDEAAGPDGRTASPHPDYLANLNRLVLAAKARGVVVQVCLFVHHSVVADIPTHPQGPGMAGPPAPVVIRGATPYDRYKAFFNASASSNLHMTMQKNLIDAIVQTLLPHWNVVYEIGNELRVPQPNATYNETHLKAWIEWAANRIRSAPDRVPARPNDNVHLITTSTAADNAVAINKSPLIQFCSFHHGQWNKLQNGQWQPDYEAACQRAIDAGDKHVVFDDDGDPARRPLVSVVNWANNVLKTRGGCRVSFNHKGPGPRPMYDNGWLGLDGGAFGKPIDVLKAMKEGRAAAPPCP